MARKIESVERRDKYNFKGDEKYLFSSETQVS
jgi:hypothetical protein